MYKCGICGKEYNELDAYMRCVKTCGERTKAEAEKVRKETLEKAKGERIKHLKTLWNTYQKELTDFQKDYPGQFEILKVNGVPYAFTYKPSIIADLLDNWVVQ